MRVRCTLERVLRNQSYPERGICAKRKQWQTSTTLTERNLGVFDAGNTWPALSPPGSYRTLNNEGGLVAVNRHTALYLCEVCAREWEDHLPPLWTFMDVWPMCCGIHAFLVDTTEAVAYLRSPRSP